jgi:hypothetical protein
MLLENTVEVHAVGGRGVDPSPDLAATPVRRPRGANDGLAETDARVSLRPRGIALASRPPGTGILHSGSAGLDTKGNLRFPSLGFAFSCRTRLLARATFRRFRTESCSVSLTLRAAG